MNAVDDFLAIAWSFTMDNYHKHFTPYNESNKSFGIHLFTGNERFPANDRIELALMKDLSTLHYHALQDAIFFFPTDIEAVLQIGAWALEDEKKIARVKTICPIPMKPYMVAKNMAHAAGPAVSGQVMPLLIFNEIGKRERNSSGYANDTHYFDEVVNL